MDVNYGMITIGINDHAEMELDTPVIMHPEPLLNHFVNLPDLTDLRIDEEISN